MDGLLVGTFCMLVLAMLHLLGIAVYIVYSELPNYILVDIILEECPEPFSWTQELQQDKAGFQTVVLF